ncbi:MAG: GtrA family protein [Clostridia bacterium]|nr:GtrA family protein [Clostridia bacterium]
MDTNKPQNEHNGGIFVRVVNKVIDVVLKALHLTKYREQIVYLGVGGGTTVVDWVVFALLYALLPDLSHLPFFNVFPNAIPYTAAWAAAVLFAYWASKYFVFVDAEKTKGISQFLRFVASRVFTLLLCLGTEFVFVTLLHVNELIVKYVICTVLNIVINYLTSKLLVFKKKKED